MVDKAANATFIVDDEDFDVDDLENEDVTAAQLILSRALRSAEGGGLVDNDGEVAVSDQIVLTSTDLETLNISTTPSTPVYPSSNDTGLLVLRPAVVNLGSQSSKCTEIHTPTDPAKLSLIDNKRMSVIIGCGSGLVVFFCIIVSIVSRPKAKEDETESVHGDSSISGSQHKSPGSKARSDSLAFGSAIRPSRTNSQSSSIANRINLINDNTSQAPLTDLRVSRGKESGTLRRHQFSRQATNESGPLQPPKIIKQSSTESGHSTSNKLSLHSSSDAAGAPRSYGRQQQQPPGGQSWHGTPRTDSLRRDRNGGVGNNSSTTLPRRSGDLQRVQSNGSNSLEGTLIKRRSDTDKQTSIPLIELHLVNGGPNRGPSRPKTAMGQRRSDDLEEQEDVESDYYRSGPQNRVRPAKNNTNNKPYIKYNSFANY